MDFPQLEPDGKLPDRNQPTPRKLAMKKLFKGILDFQSEDFEAHRELFKDLKSSQNPHTLFIGCCDSRVVPTLITKTNPGDLYVVRNVANIVPPYHLRDHFIGSVSAIEYAVMGLKVESIVICGHSNCGGCYALNESPESLKYMPNLLNWLDIIREVPERVSQLMKGDSAAEREWITEEVNILVQMENILSYPYVRERVESGSLKVMGWYYIIETGEIYNFNDDTGHFELVE